MTDTTLQSSAPSKVKVETPFQRFRAEFFESRIAATAFFVLLIIMVLAILAPWITPQNPYDLAQVDVLDGRLAPGSEAFAGYTMWLGSDGAGRDLYSAILYGLRISISVGLASGVIALFVGMVVGLIAAYSGGRTEAVIMRVVDLQLSFPAALVALMLVAALGKGIDKIILALVVAQWAYYARTVRATALVERGKEYVEAAQCLGLSKTRVVFRHILPNCLAPLIVVGTVQTAHAVSLEATLSFLGVGLPQTEPSLGVLIANGFEYMLSGRYWISVFPGIALLLTVASINLVGDQLRDVLNPRMKK
ncbi:ABC transporter permease [Roseibium alexandrii]|jgi:peptide/nickel transport system permease protein|uniref:Putative D,D-dipeptide transport system permease protein DdpC n=1 Tax=Roseibium alexandrii TaxID=388408 RepID=A0A0M6ZRL5_9HYPH|nr:ABC transporter permease [Roseibium alexandrii]CTQ65419.1 putative D,D-dipeptide transport system permease protein DdpC [Roseibium alexandrii]